MRRLINTYNNVKDDMLLFLYLYKRTKKMGLVTNSCYYALNGREQYEKRRKIKGTFNPYIVRSKLEWEIVIRPFQII